jgi:membrane protease YdiL (CAAX protease family)
MSARDAWTEALVRIPFATALTEEVIFRGALPALFTRGRTTVSAYLLSSLTFGLWHCGPSLRRASSNFDSPHASFADQATHFAASILVTAAAGLVLGWLRYASNSVTAPWLVHCAANVTGFVCVRLAHTQPAPARSLTAITGSIEQRPDAISADSSGQANAPRRL